MQHLNRNPQINTVCILHSNHHAVKRMDCKLLFFSKPRWCTTPNRNDLITIFALTHWVLDLFSQFICEKRHIFEYWTHQCSVFCNLNFGKPQNFMHYAKYYTWKRIQKHKLSDRECFKTLTIIKRINSAINYAACVSCCLG